MQSMVLSRESISSVYAIVIPVRLLFATSSFAQITGTQSDTVIGSGRIDKESKEVTTAQGQDRQVKAQAAKTRALASIQAVHREACGTALRRACGASCIRLLCSS